MFFRKFFFNKVPAFGRSQFTREKLGTSCTNLDNIYEWKKSYSQRDIVSFRISAGKCPVRNYYLEGIIMLTYRNSIHPCDAHLKFPEGYFERMHIDFTHRDVDRVFELLYRIPFEQWKTDETVLQNCGSPGFSPFGSFECKFGNGEVFRYIASSDPPESFNELFELLEEIRGPDPLRWTSFFMQQGGEPLCEKNNTIICPTCDTLCRDSSNYCRKCGENLIIKQNLTHIEEKLQFDETQIECATCGAWNAFTDKYCSRCGTKQKHFSVSP